MRLFSRLISLAALFFGTTASAWAGMCPMCREALASSGNAGLIKGIYLSILLIAGMPLVIAAAVGIACFCLRRKPASR